MGEDIDARLAWNSLVLFEKANKMLGCDMGENDFSQRDVRIARVATALSLELCNESFSDCVKRLAKQLSINEVKQVFKEVIIDLGEMSFNLQRVDTYVKRSNNDADKYRLKAKAIKEMITLLEQIRDLIETGVTYTVGEKQHVIYQNKDFRDKIKNVLSELEDHWEMLTEGFTRTGNITRLDSVKREVKRLIDRPLNITVDGHNKIQDVTPDDKRTPRQIGGQT